MAAFPQTFGAVYQHTCGAGGGAAGSTVAAALSFFAASQCLLTGDWPASSDVRNGSRFDYIVVGAGSAGAVLAGRLAELDSISVLLVEAGGDPPEESIIPGFRDVFKLQGEYDWHFSSVDDHYSSQALENGSQKQPRGKLLGGSGSINDMVYSRGFPADYEEWATTLGEVWNWTSVLDYFKKTEDMTDESIIDDPDLMMYHGRGGRIQVSGQKESSLETDRFLEAFQELGFEIVMDMTNPSKLGAGRFSHTIRNGQRDSSATAFLNKSVQRHNLYTQKNTYATKILIQPESKMAYGIEVWSNNETLVFYADREVILSAGTFNTAKLLMLSGIGPMDHLEELDIDVIQDLPVGENLHDHAMVLTYIAVDKGTCTSTPAEGYYEIIKYLYDQSGLYSKSDSMGVYLTLYGSDPSVPDFALYPVCIPQGVDFYANCKAVLGFKENICSVLNDTLVNHEVLSIAVVLLKPQSRGSVKLKSDDPFDSPLIYSGTFNNTADLDGFPEAMEVAYSLIKTTYFSEKRAHVIDFNITDCEDLTGSEQLKCVARAMVMSAWHSVGSAAMGSVVDPLLRVEGIHGLRVVDASVMPTVTRGNTNAPVVMIAEKAADFIKADINSL